MSSLSVLVNILRIDLFLMFLSLNKKILRPIRCKKSSNRSETMETGIKDYLEEIIRVLLPVRGQLCVRHSLYILLQKLRNV